MKNKTLVLGPLLFLLPLYQLSNSEFFELSKDQGRSLSSKKNENTKLPEASVAMIKKVSTSFKQALEKYKYMAQFPSTSYPVDSAKTEDHIASKFEKEITLGEFLGTQVKIWSEKLYYNKSEKKIVVFLALGEERLNLEINSYLKMQKTKQQVSFQQVSPILYKASILTKNLEEDNYMLLTSIEKNNKKTDFVNNFAVREKYFDFKKVSHSYISSDGNLVFNTNFDILIAGDYLLEGTIYHKDKIISAAESVVSLKKGDQMIPLDVYGKILNLKKIEGPIQLKYLALSYIKKSLSSVNTEIIKVNYNTADYQFDQFRSDSYQNEVLHQKISGAQTHHSKN